MVTHKLKVGCHCGNVLIEIELKNPPAAYNPRVCDCDFCRKHGASYISDPQGALLIEIKDQCQLGSYRQGSEIAVFLLCKNCGVLVAITFQDNRQLYAAVNSKTIDGDERFGAEKPVSPRKLSGSEKIERWKENWLGNVSIKARSQPAFRF